MLNSVEILPPMLKASHVYLEMGYMYTQSFLEIFFFQALITPLLNGWLHRLLPHTIRRGIIRQT